MAPPAPVRRARAEAPPLLGFPVAPTVQQAAARAPRSRPHWRARRLGSAAAIVLACVLGAACTGGPSAAPSTAPPATSPSPSAPPRVPFAFASVKFSADTVTGKSGSKVAKQAGADIQDTLTAFYDAAFADPAAWSGTIAADTWNSFEASLRDRARDDAPSLTIGSAGTGLSTLTFPQSKLTVRVLVDQHGKAQAAIATVTVDGEGTTADGASMALTNRASFILEPNDGTWRILGYPHVKTSVEPGS
jgi:hypothetical protein